MDQNKDPRNLTMFGFQPNNKNDNASNDSSRDASRKVMLDDENLEEEQETKANRNVNEPTATKNTEVNPRVLQPQLTLLTKKIKMFNQTESLIANAFYRSFETNLEALPVSFYISPLASLGLLACRNVDLLTVIHEKFILDSKQRSLLILGDPGSGKTMVAQYLAYDYWLRYRGEKNYLPIYIRLPEIDATQREKSLLENYLQDHCGLQKHEAIRFKHERQILLILDGFDELPQKNQLHKDNRWGKNIKVITTCRFEAMVTDQETYQTYFYPPRINTPTQAEGVFQEWQLQPFNSAQVKLYLRHYVAQKTMTKRRKSLSTDKDSRIDWTNWQTYEKYLQEIPGLSELTATPVILFFVCEALPAIVAELIAKENAITEEKNRTENEIETKAEYIDEIDNIELLSSLQAQTLLRADIYRLFIQEWFLSQTIRLENRKELKILKTPLEFHLQTYAQNLAALALAKGHGKLDNIIEVDDTLNLDLLLPQPGEDKKIKTLKSLAMEDIKKIKQLSENDPDIEVKIMQAIRSGCLLRTSHASFSFMHKSLIEYLVAEDLFKDLNAFTSLLTQTGVQFELSLLPDYKQLNKTHDKDNKKHNNNNIPAKHLLKFNQQLLMQEPQILQMLADFIKKCSEFEGLLFKLINFSKIYPLLSIAAANAITILKLAGIRLTDRNFNEVCIRGADLSGAILSNTNFEGADLSGVNFARAWLEGVNFKNANLDKILFGEQAPWRINTPVTCLAYSPDGKFLAIGESGFVEDNFITFLFVRSPSSPGLLTYPISVILVKSMQDAGITTPAPHSLTPTPGLRRGDVIQFFNGEKLYDAMTNFFSIELWSAEKGERVGGFRADKDSTFCLAFSPVGKYLVSGGGILSKKGWLLSNKKIVNTLCLWEIETKQLITTFEGHTDLVLSVAFSPDGQYLVSGSCDHTVRLWEVKSQKLIATFEEHKDTVNSVAFSPDGVWFASGSSDNTIFLWEVESRQLKATFKGHTDSINSIVFSPDGYWLASGSSDCTVLLWKINSSQPEVRLTEHTCSVSSLAFNKNGQWLASGSLDHTICLWDVRSQRLITKFKGRDEGVRSIAFSPDGQSLASGTSNNTISSIRLWNIGTQSFISMVKKQTQLITLALSKCGRWLASSNASGKNIYLSEFESQRLIGKLEGELSDFCNLIFSPNGECLAGIFKNKLFLWEIRTQRFIELEKNVSGISNFAFSSDGLWLVGVNLKKICVWEVKTQRLLMMMEDHPDNITGLVFSPDKKRVATIGEDKALRLYEVKSSRLSFHSTLGKHHSDIYCITFSPDNQWIATGDIDHNVYLWDVKSQKLMATLKGHIAKINSLAFSVDSRWLASGSSDNSVRLWKVEAQSVATKLNVFSGDMSVAVIEGHESSIKQVVFSLNEKWLLSLDEEGNLLQWRILISEKIKYYLYHSSCPLYFNSHQTQIDGAAGLSLNQLKLLKHCGAVGTPSKVSYVHPRSRSELKQINFKPEQATNKKRRFSVIDPSLLVNYDNWVVSILRHDKSEHSQHAFLILEGMDAFGRGFLAKYHLVENRENEGMARILYTLRQEINLEDYQKTIDDELLKRQKTTGFSFSITRQKGLDLHELVIKDQQQDIYYAVSGNRGMSPGTSNSGKKSHSCFTWAREKLYQVIDEKRLKGKLPERWTDFVVAVTSWYLPTKEFDQNNRNCLVM